MSFSIHCFAELIVKYNSWDSLRNFLTSEEGGKLRVIEPINSELALFRYTRETSDFSVEHVHFFRSVIWNKTTNRPVCVAPAKAEETAISEIPTGSQVRVMDFVEGTMINAWKPKDRNESHKIATRSSLGANGKFYSERSFAELFNDALTASGGSHTFLDSVLKDDEFASFVIQHREHKVVGPIAYNRVYVTYFGRVDADGVVTMSCTEMPERLMSYMPEKIKILDGDYESSTNKLLIEHQKRGYMWQGLVLQDMTTSRRWRLRNPDYVVVRTLRGSEANPIERFLRLREAGDVKKYLTYFREENKIMWEFEQFLRHKTSDLYLAYNEMNKLKTKTMRDFPYGLRPHVYILHGLYLQSAKNGAVNPITKDTVIGYVNNLTVEEQLKLLDSSN